MWKLVATRNTGGQRRYCSQIQYCLLVLLVPMMLFLVGAGALATNAHTNSPQFQTPEASTIPPQETHVMGETFKMGNLQYKVNSVKTLDGDDNVDKSSSQGKNLLLVDLTIENHGSADTEVRRMIGFKLRDNDGKMQAICGGATLAVKNAIDGTIKAGEKMTGVLGYEVLKGAQTFELTIISDPLNSKSKIATVRIPI